MNNRNQLNTMNLQGMESSAIKAICPVAYQTKASNAVSDNYTFIPTSKIIDDMDALGWKVGQATMVRSRKNSGFQKHLIKFFNPSIEINGDDGLLYPQVLLTNSHDGKAAFNFRVGLFRLVCSNGLVISDADFNNVSIRHTNYTFESLQAKISEVIAKLPGLVQKINLFKSTKLTEEQMVDFAYKAVSLRSKATVNIMDVLEATRNEDKGNDLWVVFNRIQEKVIGGSYSYGNKNRKARSVKSFQKDIELNEELFELAETYLAA